MHAIAEIAGRQFQLTQGAQLRVPLLSAAAGDKVVVDRVLALIDGDKSRFGSPALDGVTIDATVLEHGKANKVINFKMKRRKGFRCKRGHRQNFTLIAVNGITA
ncbi:MAG: 50S ribosomal protein L21 [bacterium]|jgi:large subunit ribosomal protein L21|nr:50S ribosomal protein L21 [bacterium]